MTRQGLALFSVLVVFGALSLSAEDASAFGSSRKKSGATVLGGVRVVNASTTPYQPVAGAGVYVDDQYVQTDSRGRAVMRIRTGNQNVAVSAPGFISETLSHKFSRSTPVVTVYLKTAQAVPDPEPQPQPQPEPTNPPSGGRLPLPDMKWLVEQVNNDMPGKIMQGCDNREFLFEVVCRLRRIDKRFGLNWKRGQVGSLSFDALTYSYGSNTSEGNHDVYVVDFIIASCSPDSRPGWLDVTNYAELGGPGAAFTIRDLPAHCH